MALTSTNAPVWQIAESSQSYLCLLANVFIRTLHMLSTDDRVAVLANLLKLSRPGSYVLIADEKSNLPAFKLVIEASSWNWVTTLNRRGILFIHRG